MEPTGPRRVSPLWTVEGRDESLIYRNEVDKTGVRSPLLRHACEPRKIPFRKSMVFSSSFVAENAMRLLYASKADVIERSRNVLSTVAISLYGSGTQGALTTFLHPDGMAASVKECFGTASDGASTGSLNQESSSCPQPSPAPTGACGLHSMLLDGQAIRT